MVRVAIASVALLFSGACSPAPSSVNSVWKTTCSMYNEHEKVDDACDDIDPPKIKYEVMDEGLYGYYDGEGTIYLNAKLKYHSNRGARAAVMLHEMVHYLDKKYLGVKIPGPAIDICMSEDRAFIIEGEYIHKEYNQWWRNYPHCWEYYSTGPVVTLYVQSKEE